MAFGWARMPSTVAGSFQGDWPWRSELFSPSAPQAPSPYFSSYQASTSDLASGNFWDGTRVVSHLPGQPWHCTAPVAMGARSFIGAKVAWRPGVRSG